jgi:Fe2+ transport system protein B
MGILGSPFSLMADATQAGTVESIEEPLLKLAAAVMMVLMIALAIPCIVTGAALRRFRPWARDTSMVVLALLLAIFPVGTLLSVYGFWVVLSPEVEPLFSVRRD